MWLIRCESGCSASISTPGHFGAQVGQNGFQELVAADAGVWVHGENVFADVHGLGMFVQLGTTGAAGEMQDGPVGIAVGLLHCCEFAVDDVGNFVRRF